MLGVFLNTIGSRMPTKANDGDLCYDFYSVEDVSIRPGQTKVVDLGVNLCLPRGYGMILHERSGMASRGVIIGAGVIDNGYRGPLKAVVRWMPADGGFDEELTAASGHPVYQLGRDDVRLHISKGDKIVQGRLVRVEDMPVVELTREFILKTNTERGDGGFGSTGT